MLSLYCTLRLRELSDLRGGREANFRKSISDGLARFNISRSEWLTVCREDERGWRKRVEEGGVFCLGEWLSKRAASKAKRDSGVDLVAQTVHRQSLRDIAEEKRRGGPSQDYSSQITVGVP